MNGRRLFVSIQAPDCSSCRSKWSLDAVLVSMFVRAHILFASSNGIPVGMCVQGGVRPPLDWTVAGKRLPTLCGCLTEKDGAVFDLSTGSLNDHESHLVCLPWQLWLRQAP